MTYTWYFFRSKVETKYRWFSSDHFQKCFVKWSKACASTTQRIAFRSVRSSPCWAKRWITWIRLKPSSAISFRYDCISCINNARSWARDHFKFIDSEDSNPADWATLNENVILTFVCTSSVHMHACIWPSAKSNMVSVVKKCSSGRRGWRGNHDLLKCKRKKLCFLDHTVNLELVEVLWVKVESLEIRKLEINSFAELDMPFLLWWQCVRVNPIYRVLHKSAIKLNHSPLSRLSGLI